jgi:hypothetical protein
MALPAEQPSDDGAEEPFWTRVCDALEALGHE